MVPGLYGYVSACKWVTELELSRFADFDAYWVPRGWAQQAPIKTESRIDAPRDGSTQRAGTVMVAGVAWAQHRGVAKVEVQVDGGAWQAATLAETVSSDTWRQWSYPGRRRRGSTPCGCGPPISAARPRRVRRVTGAGRGHRMAFDQGLVIDVRLRWLKDALPVRLGCASRSYGGLHVHRCGC